MSFSGLSYVLVIVFRLSLDSAINLPRFIRLSFQTMFTPIGFNQVIVCFEWLYMHILYMKVMCITLVIDDDGMLIARPRTL